METQKEKIQLTEEQETLLITLYSKAAGCPETFYIDKTSGEILEKIDYDFSGLKIPLGTRLTVCIRAEKIDDYAREFLTSHPEGVVLHLGCGLDTRCTRVDKGQATWYDLDMPEVIELRRKFFKETDRYHMIASSVNDLRWMDVIQAEGRAVLVIAEGLMMYLEAEQVKSLVLKLKESFPGCRLVFDAYSTLTVRNVKRHPSIRRTGAVIQWGIDDPKTIESWAEGIRLKEEWYFNQSEDIRKLALWYRLIFALTGLFSVARKAHRILYYVLQA